MINAAMDYTWNLGVQLRPAVMPYINYKYQHNAEDVLQAGLLEFAMTRKPAELAVIPRHFQAKQLKDDCWKAAIKLGIISAKIDEEFDSPAEIQRKKAVSRKIKKEIELVCEDPEDLENRPVLANEQIEAFEHADEVDKLIIDLVDFCQKNGMHQDIEMIRLKYIGMSDAAIGERLGMTAQMVQKRLKRIGELYRAAVRQRIKEEARKAKNAETPVAARVSGGSVVRI